eukprot:scaffold263_cov120-Isochrysis_galbana.AAC.26
MTYICLPAKAKRCGHVTMSRKLTRNRLDAKAAHARNYRAQQKVDKELLENDLASLRSEEEELAATAVLLGKSFAEPFPPLCESEESDNAAISDTEPELTRLERGGGGQGGLTRKEKKALAARKARKRSRAHLAQVESETLRLRARVAVLRALVGETDLSTGKRQRVTQNPAGRLCKPPSWVDDID